MKPYKSIFEESFEKVDKDKKYHIIAISNASTVSKRDTYFLGFKSEKNADLAEEYFNKASYSKPIGVDNYGFSTLEEALNYFGKSGHYNIVAYTVKNTDKMIRSNPNDLAKQVYDKIKIR